MRTRHTFLIESDSTGHRLAVNGCDFGTFATVDAAEVAGNRIARSLVPAATLRFELDFKWTLSDSEIRVAVLLCKNEVLAVPEVNHYAERAS